MAVEHLTKANADGTSFGQSSSDKITFFAGTPVVKTAATTTLAGVTTMTGLTGGIGFSTITQFQDFITSFKEMRNDLVALGLL